MDATIPLSSSQSSTKKLLLGIPFYIYVGVFASLSVVVGLLWDIAWHMSIGRDKLLSPPHDLIYLGAALAGIFSGFQVLKTSFWGKADEKNKMVHFWGIFYSSLGGLFCIWGCISALTSAPFDDWWHNTYGLDVQIFSPPHTVLVLGLIGIQMGAMIAVLAILNRKDKITELTKNQNEQRENRLRWMFMLAAGLLLTMVFTFFTEFLNRFETHNTSYYQIASAALPILLVAFARASGAKWGATYISLIHFFIYGSILWILNRLPAEPMLGPVENHITHYQTSPFPLLLFFPALTIDWLRDKYASLNDWWLALILGAGFLMILFIVQYPFGGFLMESPAARNWFFNSTSWTYNSTPDWEFRYKYADWMLTKGAINWIIGLGIAFLISVFFIRIGLAWGKWMKKVQR